MSSDVIFLVGDTKEPIHARKSILIRASPVFEAQFGERWDQENKIEIPDVSPEAFRMFLEFLYTDRLTVTENEVEDVLFLAHKYLMTVLAKKCIYFLASVINVTNVIHIHLIAIKFHSAFLNVRAMEFLLKNPSAVLEDSGFSQIGADTLKMIIKSDKLATDEITIFRAVMRWAEQKCKDENLNYTAKIKRLILKDLLPLIRFTLMTSEDLKNEIAIGQHEGLLSDTELASLFNYMSAKPLMRSHLELQSFEVNERYCHKDDVNGSGVEDIRTSIRRYHAASNRMTPLETFLGRRLLTTLPFNVNKRRTGFLYKVNVQEPGAGYFDTMAFDNIHCGGISNPPEPHCETTIGFSSSRNIWIKGIELGRDTLLMSTSLAFHKSSYPYKEFGICAQVSLTDSTHPEKPQIQKGLFVVRCYWNMEFESGVRIEKDVQYNIKNSYIRCQGGGHPHVFPKFGVKLKNTVKTHCEDDVVDFTFTDVSSKCHLRGNPHPNAVGIPCCISSDQIRTIHFTR